MERVLYEIPMNETDIKVVNPQSNIERAEIAGKDIKYRDSGKFDEWMRLYSDRKNKETYFNATESAIQAYQYDREKQYSTAAVQGHRNMKKAKHMAHMYAEQTGLTFDKMIGFAAKEMIKENNPRAKDWWDSLMELFGYKEDKADVEVTVPIQINNAIAEEVKRFK